MRRPPRIRPLLGVAAACLGVAALASAYFTGNGSGDAMASVGALATPSIEQATVSGATVALAWSAAAPAGTTYFVTRDGGAAGGDCATASAPAAATSCTDAALAPGSHAYMVTAVWHTWTRTSAPVTVDVTAVALSPTSGSVGSTIALSGTGFPPASTVSATFDGAALTLSPATMTDGAGSFSGANFTMPVSTAGAHTVAVTAGGRTGSAVFTVVPSIGVSPASGVAGSTATIGGTGFGGSKTITATLGGSAVTLTGTTGTAASGSFAGATFTVPNLAPGAYTLAVSDGSAPATTTFTIPTPAVTLSPTSGNVGATVAVSGSGFPVSSSVAVTYDGASVTISATSTDASGSFSGATFTVPASAAGAHTVQATAATRSASASFTVAPKVALAPSTGNVGSSVTASGSGFPAGSAVSATYDGVALSVSTTTTDGSGSFSGATFAVPASTAGSHTVAFTAGASSASASFTVVPSIAVSPGSGVAGSSATISGTGFGGSKTITATLAGSAVTLTGTTTTAANGSFTGAAFTVPNQAPGAKTLTVSDNATSPNSAGTSFTIPTPAVTLSPTSGNVGATVSLSGTGFPASSPVAATYDGAAVTIPATSTNASGSFSGATLTVPASAAGAHTVQATVATRPASASFTVAPKITLGLSTGNVGATVTVSGSGFPAGSAVSATYDGAAVTVSPATSTDGSGSFSGATFAVPASTAGAHTVAFTAGASSASAGFTVAPRITLTPATGAGGSAAAIAGTGFGPSSTLAATFEGASLALGGTTTTDASGGFSAATYTVPVNGSGTYTVQVTDVSSNTASASFSIGGNSVARASAAWSLASTWAGLAKTGTIVTTNSSTTVTGTSTLFQTQVAVGDALFKSDGTTLLGTVASIASNTSLTLTANAASSNANIAYAASRVPTASDDVFIATGPTNYTVSIPSGYPAVAASLTMGTNTDNTAAGLTFADATSSLEVGGSIDMRGPNAGATSNLNVGVGTLTAGGNITFTNAPGTTNHNNRLARMSISTGSATIAGKVIFNSVTSTAGSEIALAVIFSGAGALTTSTIELQGSQRATLTPSTGTVNFLSGSAQTIPIGVSSVTYGNLTLNNTSAGGATLSAAVTATNVTGNLRVLSGTLANGGFAVVGAAGKTFEVAAGAAFKLTGTSVFPTVFTASLAATSTVEYAGALQTVASTPAYGNLTVSGGSTKTALGDLTVNGSIAISSGTTFAAATFNHAVKGAFTNDGTFTAATSTVSLSGSAAQTIGGSSATTFNNLTLANAVSLSGVDVTVGGTLALGANLLSTGPSKVIANGTVTRSTGFVDGRLQKPVATGASAPLFEIGSGATYAPIGLTISGASAGGTLTASSTAGLHASFGTSGLSATKYVNRWWTLTAGGSLAVTSYNAAFTFVAGDLVGSPNTGALLVRRFGAGAWTAPVSSSSTATTVTGTGLTAFGDFAAGN